MKMFFLDGCVGCLVGDLRVWRWWADCWECWLVAMGFGLLG